jgi:hypothetical protein
MSTADIYRMLEHLRDWHNKRWEKASKEGGIFRENEAEVREAFREYMNALCRANRLIEGEGFDDGGGRKIKPERGFMMPSDDNLSENHNEEAAVGHDDQDKLLHTLRTLWHPDLPFTDQERVVLTRRTLGHTDRDIARTTPGMSGPSQVHRIEERAVEKLARHYSKSSNDL